MSALPSLIAGPQLDLLELPAGSDGEAADGALRAHESVGVFSGARFFARRPDAYRIVVRLLAAGLPIRLIAETVQVSEHTVLAVAERESTSVIAAKEHISRRLSAAARLAWDAVVDDLVNPVRRSVIETVDKAKIANALTDKWMLLAGEATHRLEVTLPAEEPAVTYARFLASLKPTGLDVEQDASKNPGAARDDQAGPEPQVVEVDATPVRPSDSESGSNPANRQ